MTSGVPGIVLLVLEKLDWMDKMWSNAASWCVPSCRCRSSKDEVLKTNLKDLFQGHVRLLNVVLVLAAGMKGKKVWRQTKHSKDDHQKGDIKLDMVTTKSDISKLIKRRKRVHHQQAGQATGRSWRRD